MGQLTNPEVYQCSLIFQPRHTEAHPLVFNRSTRRPITAQLGPPTYPFIFSHRQVGPDRQTPLFFFLPL
jgi:hypothetical protein